MPLPSFRRHDKVMVSLLHPEAPGKKYNRSAMGKTCQLQCNALRKREKTRGAENNGEQWKKQWITMKRTMTKNNGKKKKSEGCLRPVVSRLGMTAPEKAKRVRSTGSGRANVTLHLMPCALRAANASEIQSIPAIQGAAPSVPALDTLDDQQINLGVAQA